MHFIARLNDVKLSVPGIWLLTLTSNYSQLVISQLTLKIKKIFYFTKISIETP